ncbi:nuclear transport factor 2 family protein [Ancylobacter sp. MQZ15Z-1]|uniref:Nuclear transport factor 2 family protein n=1 Tax=Ancylobacter mangrovi TaxID=2972472 RepID=A0A9X2T539_9HYPH|nr:nuclear transport factor 2 family protein [Ancylobacter mangrovi]MCS0495054.1 nuclear transport factor 2 family protein [Ancylobacter mangrovi]
MTLLLPAPIAAYFAADRHDGDAVARCFTETGMVRDEKREHKGRAAIARWKAEASDRYQYTVEPRALIHEGDSYTVTGHVAGNFPGSPVDLRYIFRLEGDLIAHLEIVP